MLPSVNWTSVWVEPFDSSKAIVGVFDKFCKLTSINWSWLVPEGLRAPDSSNFIVMLLTFNWIKGDSTFELPSTPPVALVGWKGEVNIVVSLFLFDNLLILIQ